MAQKHVISFTCIADFFREDYKQLERGENSYNSGNVKRVVFDANIQPALLKGEVQASMKNRSYSVEISLDAEDGVVAAKCSCPRGQLICHHMAALCIFGHHNVSITDQACAWNVQKRIEQVHTQTINDLYPLKEEHYCAVGRQATEDEVSAFVKKLSEPIGFSWLLKPEPSTEIFKIIPAIEDIIFSEEFLNVLDKQDYFKKACAITREKIIALADATKGQAKNANWLVCRKHRLTASHFGMVLAACRRNRYPPSLFRSLFEGYDLEHVKAVEWGRSHEAEALNTFRSSIQNVTVQSTGLWLDKCGFLGASPDGLVNNDALVEVKCPYKYRSNSLREGITNDKSYIIFKNDEGMTDINRAHPYWAQIQGQLHIVDRQVCYLVVWTPAECEILIIEREEWGVNIDILKNFYLDHCIQYLSS